MELFVDNISKSYGKNKVLDGFSAILTPGIYGLIGPNGSGKSTLMQILTHNLAADFGEIYYDGKKTSKLGMEYLSLIGYMPQEAALYPQLSIRDFLVYMASVKGVEKAIAQKQIPQILEDVSLTNSAEKRISELSGGMRQRTCLAQALLGDPKILILDEPTAGLDPAQRVALRNILAKLSIDRIILIATHVIGDVENIAKQLILLSKGRPVQFVSPQELVDRIQDKVCVVKVSKEEYKELEGKYKIVSITTNEEYLTVRLIADLLPKGAIIVEPTLEDAYLWFYS